MNKESGRVERADGRKYVYKTRRENYVHLCAKAKGSTVLSLFLLFEGSDVDREERDKRSKDQKREVGQHRTKGLDSEL